MSWWKASSLEGRLMRLILLASTLALLCVMVGVAVYEATSFQPRALSHLRQPADILKELLQPALDFDAREDVDRYLQKYCESQANPLVAVVYDDKGRVFASYPPSLVTAPDSPAPAGYKFSAGSLVIWEQLERDNQTLGYLYLREQLPPFYLRLAQYSLMLGTLFTALVIVGGTLLFGARRNILKPIAGLVKTTEHVIQYNDFSVRSDLQKDDEVGHLARTFNRMLDVISASDTSLRESEARLAADLKERKLAGMALKANEVRLNNILQTSLDGFWRADWQGRILEVNLAYCQVSGYSERELLTLTIPDLEAAETASDTKAHLEKIRTLGKDFFESKHRRKDGSIFDVEISVQSNYGSDDEMVVFIRDITERKQVEAALRKSEESLTAAQTRARIGSWEFDLIEQKGAWSAEMYRLLGRHPECGVPTFAEFLTLVHPADRETFEGKFTRAITEHTGLQLDFRVFLPDGRLRWIASLAELILDDTAQPARIIGTSQDITERKQAEAALQSHRDQLQQLNQELDARVRQRTAELEASNQELEAFNYSVSHDLRAPLRHVAGFIELLKRQGYASADKKCQHYMQVISASAVQMGNMVDDILTFSRLGRTEMRMTHVNLNNLVKAALSILQPEIKGREIRWIISPLPSVEGEREMLQRVITNLIGNALKYSRPRAVAVIEVSAQSQGDENIYCIKDNGVGFDMRYEDKLFGIFQRLHRDDEFEGAGIGLANVQRIIQRHGGRVWAEGKVDEGASFYFSLPMLQPTQKTLQ